MSKNPIPDDLSVEIVRKYLDRIAWRRKAKLEQRGNFDEKYPEDALTAFLVSGVQYFDKDIVIARKRELVNFKPWREFSNGACKIFRQRVPNRRYLCAGDVATGRTVKSDETDFCAAVVGDIETGEEVAAYRARVHPADFAYDLAEIGDYFNNAMMAIERTGDGGTTMLTLRGECAYGNIYMHKDWHRRLRKVIEYEGFPTTSKTRPVALNFVSLFINDNPELIWDTQFLGECLTFVRNEKGIPAAAPGSHDDTVSARWIFHFVRRVQMGWLDPTKFRSERYADSGSVNDDNTDE